MLEGRYLSVDGTQPVPDWELDEPDGGSPDCVAIQSSGKLADKDCNTADDYICEIDGVMPDQAAY